MLVAQAPPTVGPFRSHAVAPVVSRRSANCGLLSGLLVLPFWSVQEQTAHASLLQFPVTKLHNNYYLSTTPGTTAGRKCAAWFAKQPRPPRTAVRAGESAAAARGRVLSNPVAKTSMDAALSAEGRRQVVKEAYPALRRLGVGEGGLWVWPSQWLNSYQSGEVLASLFGVGRNRLVPEFSFLDARGVGGLEGGQLAAVAEELAAGDALTAAWRPPPGSDGTPPESAADVLVRGRQLLSILETQYLGEDVLIIAPDSDNLSILQAGVAGTDLRTHSRAAFAPGEVRRLELSGLLPVEAPSGFACPRPPQCL